MADIQFHRELAFQYGVIETLSPLVRRVVARNPSAFTADGTATFIIGRGHVAIIDPGPMMDDHVEALLDALKGETIDHLLITHTHIDHSPAAQPIKQATGAKSYGFGPHHGGESTGEAGGDQDFVPDHTMADGDELAGAGWHIRAIHTPGHASNHLCFALAEDSILFSGDHVMGWSTSVITPPDGDMADYMRSLEKLLGRGDRLYMPTHGPAIPDPESHVRAFIAHRLDRRAAILARLRAGDHTIPEIVAVLYASVPKGLHAAAGRSVLAHLIELVNSGAVISEGEPAAVTRYFIA